MPNKETQKTGKNRKGVKEYNPKESSIVRQRNISIFKHPKSGKWKDHIMIFSALFCF
jgi:hypothetical protein